MANEVSFTVSDLISGYVTAYDAKADKFGVRTSDGREFEIHFTAPAYAEMVRNLGEPYQDCTGQMRDMLTPGRYVYAYGIFYPEGGELKFDAKHLVFVGRNPAEWRQESPDWWVKQIRSIADFYIHAQWPDGNIDYRNYRTQLTVEGVKIEDRLRQETDTISRAIYGFATAYLMTGEDRFLEAAEKGTEYLRDHMRAVEASDNIVYWYHAIDRQGNRERKILASQFGDDYDAIPAYEQIYALAGPTQTYRITGDPRIRSDIDMTINLFEKYFRDYEQGGYFSHLDPITFDPHLESLGQDRARKNWNSVGDHAPAFLINLLLATGEVGHAEFLERTFDTIVEHFPDDAESPFVQEKFFEDWSKDQAWGWQQNRGVVGHNLKIAWNLMRMNSAKAKDGYVELATKIGNSMPKVGADLQRGGWYDVVERTLAPGENYYRHVWHDRKAWWQQEQAILAYLILAGETHDPEFLKQARESAAFYNAWFPDHDNGAVYFNVLANGVPYLLGTERLKGSHSMSCYHSTELCYLAAVYTNLLITRQPMTFYFKPKPGGWKDNILRVAPDLLPKGSIRLEAVWINGEPYTQFNADELTVSLPQSAADLRVQVRVAPVQPADTFYVASDITDGTAKLTLSGRLAPTAAYAFKAEVDKAIASNPKRLVLDMSDLYSMSAEGVRVLVFASEHLGVDAELYGVGANDEVRAAFKSLDIDEDVNWVGDVNAIVKK